jgi:hypothetical protein
VNALRSLLFSLVVTALAAFPGGAMAAALVPPGNSAANQYTETFPTTGGNAEAKGKGKVTPGDILGAGNAKKLDSQGRQGREAAAVVAATAPPATVAAGAGDGGGGGRVAKGGGNGGGGSTRAGQAEAGGEGASANGTGSGSGQAGSEDASGSSGFGEVLGQATGSSTSGGTGLLLPLAVLASVIWALVFFLRRKRRTA